MKKLFMFLMAAFLLIGIAACNGDDTTVATEDTTEDTTEATEDTTDATTEDTTDATTEDPYPTEATLPDGAYNYKFQTSEVRHTFMAAAERFLMTTMYGGVPLFANGGYVLYSDRLQLPVDDYVPVMVYGNSYGTMTEDDSTVIMADDSPGEVDEYTYRTTSTENPGTWNQWLYDTSTDSDIMGIYMDAPYTYQFNDDKTSYEVNPSMMTDNPEPIDSTVLTSGKEVSTVWQMEVRDDLEWFYHPETDISNLPSGHEVIDGHDFVETFKLALKNNWFRAVSGGGDFLNRTTGIKGAAAYANNPTEDNWEDVGIKLIGDHTIELDFLNDQSEWNVRYFMSSFVMTPINIDLYNELGDPDEDGSYGTSNETIAYHGAYYVDYYEADKLLTFKENPKYHSPEEFFYTGYEMQIIPDAAVRFSEFEAGKLEAVSVPTENYDDYKNNPGLRRVPGATTFRMMINGLGTEEEQQQQFPGSEWVPEPILADDNFKRAMFFAIDRKFLAEKVLKTSQTQMYYFSDAYLIDPEEDDTPYRQTEQGQTVGEGLAPGSNGYNKDAAVAYWELAVEELYEKGDIDYGDTIDLEFNIFTGSEAQTLLGRYIETTFEETFVHEELQISVDIEVLPKDFPSIYYDYMMTGNFDLSIGGISGSTLDAASFLDVFCDDDRGGFTLNWGIDTSTAEIPVKYETYDYDDEGEITDTHYHYEMWSFNAITSILNGQAFIQDGEEADVPRPVITGVTPTTMTFEIKEFNNPTYTNLKYTIQEWDFVNEKYDDVDGMVDVDATTDEITVSGLKPYPNNYQIILYYDLASGENDVPFEESTWGYMGQVVESVVATDTDIVITLNTDEADFDRVFEDGSIVVYEVTYDEDEEAIYTDVTDDVTITIVDEVVTIDGLDPETEYYIPFDTDDGFEEYANIVTEATPTE